jgi:hypothetical protein
VGNPLQNGEIPPSAKYCHRWKLKLKTDALPVKCGSKAAMAKPDPSKSFNAPFLQTTISEVSLFGEKIDILALDVSI